MAEDLMRYDLMAQMALKGVVRSALERVADVGLPGEHHFYISFDINAPGVRTSERLRKQYPEEMTIVLQHQFWGLVVEEDRFTVELSFNNIPEKLVVPFDAIKYFFDPSVQFGLQFEMAGEEAADDAGESAGAESNPPAAANAPTGQRPVLSTPEGGEPEADNEDRSEENQSADVVELDAFRKK